MPSSRPPRRLASLVVASLGVAALVASATLPAQQGKSAKTPGPPAKAAPAKTPAAQRAKAPPRRTAPVRRPVPARGATAPSPAVVAAPAPPAPELLPLLALDSVLGPVAAPARLPVARRAAAGDTVFVHLIGRWRDTATGDGAAASVLRAALRARVRVETDGAAYAIGPQDAWQLGGGATAFAVDVHGPAGEIVARVGRVLAALAGPVDSATLSGTAQGLARDVDQRATDATARGFAALAERSGGRDDRAPADIGTALRAVRPAAVAARHAAMRAGLRWQGGVVAAPGIEVPVAALTAVLGAAPEAAPAAALPPPAPSTTAAPSAAPTRLVTPEAGWSFAGLAVRLPLAPDDSDWVALRIAALALGGVPGANRFDTARDAATLGGGATLDGTVGRRDAAFTVWSATTGDPAAALRAWRGLLDETRRSGFTDAEVGEASRLWLSARADGRSRPVVLARLLAERSGDGRRFASWDGGIERRGRALTGAQVTAAFRRQVDPARMTEVVVGPRAR